MTGQQPQARTTLRQKLHELYKEWQEEIESVCGWVVWAATGGTIIVLTTIHFIKQIIP